MNTSLLKKNSWMDEKMHAARKNVGEYTKCFKMFLYFKRAWFFLCIGLPLALLRNCLRFLPNHFSYTGSYICVHSVPSKNSVSGERTALAATFGHKGGCCSGILGLDFVSLLFSANGTRQVHGSFLSCSFKLTSATFCFWATSSSIGLMFSGLSLRASRNLLKQEYW